MQYLEGRRTLKIRGHDFSFLVTEPQGWLIDVESAVQVANFVMYPEGTRWREAKVMAFSRFFRRNGDENLKQFLHSQLAEQVVRCPALKIKSLNLNLKAASHPKIIAKSCTCPGKKREVIALTETSDYFAIFVLSARDHQAVSNALPSFQELLSSFQWLGNSSPSIDSNNSKE